MVVTDRQHQVAMRLVQIGAHDGGSRGDVEAAVIDQALADVAVAQARDLCEVGEPARVDLHDAKILRSVAVRVNRADITAFHRLNRWQHARRQMIKRGSGGHAGKQRNAHRCGSRDRERGFTLLELLVVIVILGLLIGLVAPAVLQQLGRARASVARDSIERLGSVLDLYKLDIGDYPSTEQGLEALIQQPEDVSDWHGPYLKGDHVPLDPWNHPYQYRNPSTRAGHDYDLCSAGPPGQSADNPICNP
jgi:general secretion pathway protein G